MIKNCEVRKLVNIPKNTQKGNDELFNYLKNLETAKQHETLEFLSKQDIQKLSENKLKESQQFSSESRFASNRRSQDINDQNNKIVKVQKKNKSLKEKLKICEREREIALNALQQQTEHFNREQKQRKKLEEQVEQLETLLEMQHLKKNDENENGKGK
jgi:hypothetical protein